MFYKRVFEGNTLSAKYFGKVNPGKRYFLEGRFQTPIKLGPGIEIRGKLTSVTTSRVGKIVHQKIINIVENSETGKMEIQGRERMHGTLWLSSVQADIPVMLQFVGKSILFKASGVEDDNIGTNILGIANVRAVNVKSQSYPLKLDGPIEAVEFHSRLLIGSSEAHFISVAGGRENTAQYIHGDNSKNKFYACKKSDLNVVLRNLFQAFGATLRLPILDTATVKDACFTYHNGEEPNWEVPNRGFTAERGLRLYGKLHADFGINMPLVVLFEGSAVRMVAELTPLRWGVTKEEVDRKTPQGETIKVQRDVSRIQMTMSEDEEIMGPQLHIEYQNGVYSNGFIEGYIRAPGFEGTGRINIMEDTEGRPTKYEFTHTGLIYGVIEGSLKLAATYTGRNMNEIDFQLEVDLLSKVREKIPDVIQESINEFNEPYDNVVNKLDVDIRKTSELYRTHSTTHNSLRENVDALSARTKKSKLERARSLQAVSKRCARECKPVYMPGLKWENKCTTLKKQKDSRCIKFVKDSHKVSDVGCMAQCESERVKSHAEAIHHDNVARSTIARLSDATECKDLAEFLVNDIQNVKEELERIKTDLATLAKFIHDIKTASQSSAVNILNFASILSAYPIKEAASQPSCLKFRLGYTVTTSEEDTSKEIEMEDKIICFQDEFVKSVTNMALREAYKENYEVLQPKLDAAVKWHSELLGNFYEDVTERGEQLQRCITNSPSPDDDEEKRKRSFIANAKLSPIRSSLFNVMSERTTLMFHKYSPWSVLMKNNPFNEARPAVTKATIEDVTPEDSCLATRHIVQNYQDIVGYMKVWATSLQSGQKTFEKVNDMVGKRLTAVRSAINKMATGDHILDVHADNMNHWMNVTENGMKKWLDVSSQRLHHLNKDGLKLIKEELSYMYSDKEYKSIDEYIQNKAKKGNNAFKRANIPGKDEKPFSQPSQQLLQIFAKGESLQGVLPIIKEIEAKLVHVDKRSISCHLK
ncbi:uncharacterized protein LOC130622925 isoform X2 [Hydractinia symbiolongicarpus]|nr:uncharacterized protein LOC130622925 isoform X2 [Hydractinia symbiolongicarpus]